MNVRSLVLITLLVSLLVDGAEVRVQLAQLRLVELPALRVQGLGIREWGSAATHRAACVGNGQLGSALIGAVAKVMDFDRLGRKVRPGTFGKITAT